jgi:hypothetical protein
MAATDISQFLAELKAAYPWTAELGLTAEWFQQTAAEATGPDEILAKIRQTPQHKARFPAMRRADGSVRLNEAQYLAREVDYRRLLVQHGLDPQEYSNPVSLVGFFEAEIDPNELRDRLTVWRQVQESGPRVRDAFYVYAGLDVSMDDLFEAAVDPAAGQRLTEAYNAEIAGSQFDYQTYITRATEVGLQRVATELGRLQSHGALTGQVVQSILRTDPGFARNIMDALYTGGSGEVNQAQPLALEELLASFEQAVLGSAALGAGLSLPTKERIAQIRQAGVDRARAQQAYMDFGMNRGVYNAAVQRARGTSFGQDQFEKAAFLGDAGAAQDLRIGIAAEEAAGQRQGTFRMTQDPFGRIVQRSLRA